MDKLPEAEQEEFKAKSQGAMKLLLGKIKELQFGARNVRLSVTHGGGGGGAPPPPPPPSPPGRPGLRPR